MQTQRRRLKKKERQGETRFTSKTEVPLPLNANVFFFFLESHPIYDQTNGSSVVFLSLCWLQKHYEITFFTLFYIYIVLHSRVKSYIYI